MWGVWVCGYVDLCVGCVGVWVCRSMCGVGVWVCGYVDLCVGCVGVWVCRSMCGVCGCVGV